MTAAAKKLFSFLLKAGLLVLAFVFIYSQYIKKGDNLKEFEKALDALNHTHVIIVMTVVVFLMLANWFVECLKWKFITERFAPLTVWRSIEGVFCGLTWAVFTPNRIGEYGGRVMFLPPHKRMYGVFAMAVGSFGQNVVTNVMGASAILWFCYTFLNLSTLALSVITLLVPAYIALFLVVYFNIKWIVSWLDRISFLKKYRRFFDIMGAYKFDDLIKIMGFCLTRFGIFSFQYYLIIHMLVPELPFYQIELLVFIVFFVQSALPSLDLIDVSVRASASATVFAYVTQQEIAIIAAFTAIWLINLIIPAILGSVFIFKLKFFDRNN
ncbi:hypothetical protein [Mucilaginibacter antarcticus]|uniref:Lysylphosphatidylglycerol synthase-like protein n=2 Tax=Mucilaginibacter antarcticus TaxID=1855725 RepID=A0ABW5XNP1_9SPHI